MALRLIIQNGLRLNYFRESINIASIQIITEPGREPFHERDLVGILADEWRRTGHEVAAGPVDRLEADVGLLHIDRTWVDSKFVPSNPDEKPLLNGRLLDISKRTISKLVLNPNSGWTGPVIIKTNANANGFPDLVGNPFAKLVKLRRRLSNPPYWHVFRHLPFRYMILKRSDQVPGWVWRHRDLVVEKFLPEREGDRYAIRIWLYLGSKSVVWRQSARSRIVKSGGSLKASRIEDVPDDLVAFRRSQGADFGKIDFAIVDGQTVIYDINKTPHVASTDGKPSYLAELATGIEDFF